MVVNLSERIDGLELKLSRHVDSCERQPCQGLEQLIQRLGEVTINVELSDAKVDALAKQVGTALLPTILKGQEQTRNAMLRAKRAGIIIAMVFGALFSAYQAAGEMGILKSAQAQQKDK
jgi:hypothetical protein